MLGLIICLTILVNIAIAQDIQPISDMKYPKPFGLFYDSQYRKLFWADYLLNQIVCYDFVDGRTYAATTEPKIAPWYIVPYENNPYRFLVNDGVTNHIVDWDTKSSNAELVRPAFTMEAECTKNILTIAKVAPNCDLIFGTLRTTLCADGPNSATYKYNEKCGVKKIFSHQVAAGEIEWNLKGTKFYQLSSCKNVVREYHYNRKTGKISGGHIVYTYNGESEDSVHQPVLFGITLDMAGYLYLAAYHGGKVIVVNPKTGQMIREIAIPGPVVASLAWGGDNLETLYVSCETVPRDFFSGKI